MLVPAYNEAETIGDTIESLLAQTVPAAEIIVIDDCSTDATAEVARSYGVTVLQPPANTGTKAGAQNFALKTVATEYTMAIDGDTIVAPGLDRPVSRGHGGHQHHRRLRLRGAALRQLGVGARPLHRIPAGVQLLQADPGSLRQAADRIRLFLDLSDRTPALARRLADADHGRGHGSDVDDVQRR